MPKIISGDAMIARVKKLYEEGKVDLSYFNIVREAVQMEPAIEAEPVVHARWIYGHGTSAKCSNCHRTYYDAYDLDNSDRRCRGCGAIMDKGE